jgi:hypothetical protein
VGKKSETIGMWHVAVVSGWRNKISVSVSVSVSTGMSPSLTRFRMMLVEILEPCDRP